MKIYQWNEYTVFVSEITPITDGPSLTGNLTSVKTDQVPEGAIDNAVAMTIRNADLSEVNNNVEKATAVTKFNQYFTVK